MMEEQQKEPIYLSIIRTLIKDQAYIYIMLLLFILLIATALNGQAQIDRQEEQHRTELADCGCIPTTPYQHTPTLSDTWNLKETYNES